QRGFEVAELEHQDREDAEDRDDDGDADAAEGLLRGFLLATQRVVISAWPLHGVQLLRDLLGELPDVVALGRVGIDGHASFAIEALDQRWRALELHGRELR